MTFYLSPWKTWRLRLSPPERRLRSAGLAGLRWSILGGTLGLKLLGAEYAIAPVAAFGKSLRIVLESVWGSFRAGIDDIEGASLLGESELNVGTLPMDGAWLHVPSDAKTLAVNSVTHFAHLFDGDIVALALLHATDRQIGKAGDDEQDRHTKLQILIHFPSNKELA